MLVEGPLDAIAVTWASHTTARAAAAVEVEVEAASAGAGAGAGACSSRSSTRVDVGTGFVGVAVCGTALTGGQIELLLPHLDSAGQGRRNGLVVAYDSDPAGRQAAVRALDALLERDTWPLASLLPAGLDPAEIARSQGPAALLAALEHAVPLADVAVDARLAGWTGSARWAEGRVGAARDAAQLIARLPARHVARQVQRVAAHLQLPHEEVTSLVTAAVSTASTARPITAGAVQAAVHGERRPSSAAPRLQGPPSSVRDTAPAIASQPDTGPRARSGSSPAQSASPVAAVSETAVPPLASAATTPRRAAAPAARSLRRRP